jgi:hypothetical protein
MPAAGAFKLFIGNLEEKTQPSEIRPLFEKYGKIVECDVIKNYGFVHMENEQAGRGMSHSLSFIPSIVVVFINGYHKFLNRCNAKSQRLYC